MKKVIITGANGQLGKDLVELIDASAFEVVAFTKSELDITNESAVQTIVNSIQPDWILHAAAYTNVEAAEDEGKEQNWLVNATGTEIIAKAAKTVNAKMIYVSTDYVFDGTKETPYETTDAVNPLNEYGKAKLAGEKAVQEILKEDGFIIRTSWVFGVHGHNFVYTMLKLSETRSELNVVSDQLGRPTFSEDLARFMWFIVNQKVAGGLYHFSNEGVCSWHDFAQEILKEKAVKVLACNSDAFPQKAKRPMRSILSLSSIESLGYEIPTWQDALNRFKQKQKIKQEIE
ncbi:MULTISPECIES: dTDP-4-dehydrorhamnose reductase [unclassified Exiguobacterium]|uniref:dTDP-4-dehydrorhamnose reductase n=1 Tax=unclassified Exiguobacterium TaxID=2644629 RepID=UPI001BE87A2F|nr:MULTISPECIES: dTDP-4-dehydrorhamnose reductase [unclassified Exiguobacterium]